MIAATQPLATTKIGATVGIQVAHAIHAALMNIPFFLRLEYPQRSFELLIPVTRKEAWPLAACLRKAGPPMSDPTNPYATPMLMEMNPVAVQWLGTPPGSHLKVARGLRLIYWGICIYLVSDIGGFVLLLSVARSPESFRMIIVLIGIGCVAAWILNIVGTLLCSATPEESGALGTIYTAVAAMGVGILLQIVQWVGFMPQAASYLQGIAGIIGGILLLVFLKRLGMFIGRLDLAGKAKSILNWCIGLFVALIADIVYTVSSAGMAFFRTAAEVKEPRTDNTEAGLGFGIILFSMILIAALITFIRYANLLTKS
jgi:hypothetical protein